MQKQEGSRSLTIRADSKSSERLCLKNKVENDGGRLLQSPLTFTHALHNRHIVASPNTQVHACAYNRHSTTLAITAEDKKGNFPGGFNVTCRCEPVCHHWHHHQLAAHPCTSAQSRRGGPWSLFPKRELVHHCLLCHRSCRQLHWAAALGPQPGLVRFSLYFFPIYNWSKTFSFSSLWL